MHVQIVDGPPGKGSGVVVVRDGHILGGDAALYYTGSYTLSGNVMKGELIVNQHTRLTDIAPLFGGQEVSIGFSGTFDDHSATVTGAALVKKTSMLFKATLRFLTTDEA